MKLNARTIGFTVIIIICVVAVIMAILSVFPANNEGQGGTIQNPIDMTEENKQLARKF